MERSVVSRGINQLGRFGVVGLMINACLYLFYLLMTFSGATPVVASSVVFFVGVPISLRLHQRVTFRVLRISLRKKILFATAYVLAYLLQIGTLVLLHDGLSLPHPLAQAVAIVCAALLLFGFQKRIVFET